MNHLGAAAMHMYCAVLESLMQARNARLAPRKLPQYAKEPGNVLEAQQGFSLDTALG